MSNRQPEQQQHPAGPSKPTAARDVAPASQGESIDSPKVPSKRSEGGESIRPPTPPSKRRKGKDALRLLSSPHSAPADEGDTELLRVSAIDVEQSAHLKNWKRWAQVKDDLRLSRFIKGQVRRFVPDTVDAFMLASPRDDRNWQVVNVEHYDNSKLPSNKNTFADASKISSSYWRILVKDQKSKLQIDTTRRCAWIPDDILPQNDETFVQKVAEDICVLLNHLPIVRITLKASDPLGQLVMLSAVHRACNKQIEFGALINADIMTNKKFHAFNVTWEPKKQEYEATLLTYDRDLDAQDFETTICIKPSETVETQQIPALPSHLVNVFPKVQKAPDLSKLSAQDVAAHARALHLCRYVQCTMAGACGGKIALTRQANFIASLYKTSDEVSIVGRVYSNKPLFKLSIKGQSVRIKLSKTVLLDIEGEEIPSLHVNGHSKARVSTVLDEIVQAFLSGQHILDSWQAGVMKADQVNHAPAEAYFLLDCNHVGVERKEMFHPCQNCNEVTLCDTMTLVPNVRLRVCPRCKDKSDKHGISSTVTQYSSIGEDSKKTEKPTRKQTQLEAKQAALQAEKEKKQNEIPPDARPKKAKVYPMGDLLRHKVLNEIRRDPQFQGKPADSIEARRAVAAQFVATFRNETSKMWKDAYANAERPDQLPKVAGVRTSGFLASTDAAMPFYVEQGKTSLYHINNYVATAGYLNQATHTWLKSTLLILKDALALQLSTDYNAYTHINNRFDHAWAVRSQYPYRVDTRLSIVMKDDEYARCRAEMRRGVLDDSDEAVPFFIISKTLKQPLWTLQDRMRINNLVEQMLERKPAPIELPRGSDGGPFPWRPEHMPDNWSWDKLEGHIAYHFDLMDEWCDWLWETEEIPENILLELIWQWIDHGGRDPWWRLPMTVFAHHPTGWAFAHLHHGRPMRTGWPANAATNISQRDDFRSNVVIEPRIVNYLKMDYAEDEYPLLANDLLQNLKDETDYFVRPEQPPRAVRIGEYSQHRVAQRASRWIKQQLDPSELSEHTASGATANEGNDGLSEPEEDIGDDDFEGDFGDEQDAGAEEAVDE